MPALTLPNWVKAAARCGFNVQPIFRSHGVQMDLARIEEDTVSLETMDEVMDACIRKTRRGHFPFILGETFAFDYLPEVETFLTTSSTLRETLPVFDWVRELVNPLVGVRLEEDARYAYLILESPPELAEPLFNSEVFFASIQKFGRLLLGPTRKFRELRFHHPAPEHAEQYHRFFDMPVRFDQPHHALVMDRELLDQPLEGGFPALHRQARARVQQRVARMHRHKGLAAAVADALRADRNLLTGSIEAVAEALGMGARTLQRRLKEEGTSYASLLQEAKLKAAEELLRNTDRDLETISESLGFSDRRSFSRAFKRWTGDTPSRFRRQ